MRYPLPFVSRMTANEIFEFLAGYCQQISDSSHWEGLCKELY